MPLRQREKGRGIGRTRRLHVGEIGAGQRLLSAGVGQLCRRTLEDDFFAVGRIHFVERAQGGVELLMAQGGIGQRDLRGEGVGSQPIELLPTVGRLRGIEAR